MCHCVQTVRNFVRGRGKFNMYEEIISLQFTVHDTSHHLCKQCLRKLQKRRGLRTNLRELDQEILSSSHEIEKKKTPDQEDSQGHVLHYLELMSRVWPVNSYCVRGTRTQPLIAFEVPRTQPLCWVFCA